MAIWPPKLGTLYKVPSELFSGLKRSLFPQGFAHNTVECERNGGWRSVVEFRGENLNVLCYFCSGFYTTRRQIDGKIRYVLIFSPLWEKYVVNVNKICFHLVVLLYWSTTASLGPKFGAIAEYPAQLVVFDSTATVVRGPQSVSKVICMC